MSAFEDAAISRQICDWNKSAIYSCTEAIQYKHVGIFYLWYLVIANSDSMCHVLFYDGLKLGR